MISFFYEIKGLAAKGKGWTVLYFVKFKTFNLSFANQKSDSYYYQQSAIKSIDSNSSRISKSLTSLNGGNFDQFSSISSNMT